MALFLILALVLMSLAVACVVLPLHRATRAPALASVPASWARLLPWALAALVCFLSSGLYLWLGSPVPLQQYMALQALETEDSADSFIAALEKMVERWPDNQQTRFMLASVYRKMGRYQQAVAEFSRVVEASGGQEAEPVAQLAQARYMAQGNQIDAEMTRLVAKALRLNPDNTLALGLSGITAFEQQHYQQALQAWQRLLELTPDPDERKMLESGIARARAAIAQREQQPDKDAPAVPAAAVRVHVDLSDAFDRLPDAARVFIFARVPGRPMPVAVVSLLPSQLPTAVKLDDSNSMVAGASVSHHSRVDLVARLSLSGNALDADYETLIRNVKVGDSRSVSLVIRNPEDGLNP